MGDARRKNPSFLLITAPHIRLGIPHPAPKPFSLTSCRRRVTLLLDFCEPRPPPGGRFALVCGWPAAAEDSTADLFTNSTGRRTRVHTHDTTMPAINAGRLPTKFWLSVLGHSFQTRANFRDRGLGSKSTRSKCPPRLHFDSLENRTCPAAIYDYQVIAQSGQNGIASITQFPSINNSGDVAFVAALTAGGEGIFVGDGSTFPTNVTQVIDPNRTYLASAQINNDGQVLASERDFSPNFRQLELWDVNDPGNPQSLAGSGENGTSIFSFATLNNQGDSVFATIPTAGSDVKLSAPIPPLGFGTEFYKLPTGPQPSIRPMLADDGTVVFRAGNNETDPILTRPAVGGSSATIAGIPNFYTTGSAPGISDDGVAVAFYGDLTPAGAAGLNLIRPEGAPLLAPGPGIFVSLKTPSGETALVRIAGLFDNGYLDPGERWDNRGPNWNADVLAGTSLKVDANEDGNLDGSTAVGIREFDPNMRVGVNRESPDSPFYRVVFTAKGADGIRAVFSARVQADAKDLFAPVPVIKAGDVIPGFGTADTFSLFDPVNANGQIVVAVTAQDQQGKTAIVRISGMDPVRQTMTPSGAGLYSPDELADFITRVDSPNTPEHAQYGSLISQLRLLQTSGEFSIRRKGCLLTSVSMALDLLKIGEVSPAQLFERLEEIDGFDRITKAKIVGEYPNHVPKFSFTGADLIYAKLDELFQLQGLRTTPFKRTNGVLNTAPMQAAFSNGKPVDGVAVLVRVHAGGHWVYATNFDGQTVTFIDPEKSTSTMTDSVGIYDPYVNPVTGSTATYGITGYLVLKRGPIQATTINVQSHSPIQVLVTSPSGARVGTDAAGVTYNEVPGAGLGTLFPILDPEDSYSDADLAALEADVPRLITIPTFEPGVYQISAFGTANGPFSIDVTALLGTGALAHELTGSATLGSTQTFSLDLGAPVVTSSPANSLVAAGASASFSAAAVGNPVPTVQWQVSTNQGNTFTDVAGATSATYSFSTTSVQNGNLYRAVFTNSAGSATSASATLTVATAPVVTVNPANQVADSGGHISLTAAAVGSPTPTVQWQRSTDGGLTFANITGATATTYSTAVTAAEAYRAVFTNANGTAATAAAFVTLASKPSNVVIGGPNAQFPQINFIEPPALARNFFYPRVALANGNMVMSDQDTIFLYDGKTGRLISALTGVGTSIDVVPLTNGNFVVVSTNNAVNGSVTWVNGITGLNGSVSADNSLVGLSQGGAPSYVSGVVTAMPDGGYLVGNSNWHDLRGFVTRCDADGKTVGVISAANSLVGENSNDQIGGGGGFSDRVVVLANGNYVVVSTFWGGGRGAVTWGSGETGITGFVSEANSLVGSDANDNVGWSGVRTLPNGNYIVQSPFWNESAGAVTWASGETGVTGQVSALNSLIGTQTYDRVGESVVVLTNGNYVTYTGIWNRNLGAVTWGNGATGIVGTVSAANSLVGDESNPYLSYYGTVVPLTNGNYVVTSPYWGYYQGAVTWGDGTAGTAGVVSTANSTVGTKPYDYPLTGDQVGSGGVTALADGNYVVLSPLWNDGAGAVTWADGTVSTADAVSAANSLVGSAFDRSGRRRRGHRPGEWQLRRCQPELGV